MITCYHKKGTQIVEVVVAAGDSLPAKSLWIDLQQPTTEERNWIAQSLSINLSSPEDMQAIEASNRMHISGNATYLTVDLLVGSDTMQPALDVMMMVATPHSMITMRFCAPKSINTFAMRVKQQPELLVTAEDGVLSMLDAITDRIADLLESLGRDADKLSTQIFRRGKDGVKEKQLQDILENLGMVGDTTHKIRESISGLARLMTFLGHRKSLPLTKDQIIKFDALKEDIASLAEHAQFILQETTFLLDATLGQINIEQNNIIKFMSFVMVVFTPPTFFASMWGMNFHNMPEYAFAYGYPMAWCIMILSALIPVLYFARKKWL